jgi:hypothetical protein
MSEAVWPEICSAAFDWLCREMMRRFTDVRLLFTEPLDSLLSTDDFVNQRKRSLCEVCWRLGLHDLFLTSSGTRDHCRIWLVLRFQTISLADRFWPAESSFACGNDLFVDCFPFCVQIELDLNTSE